MKLVTMREKIAVHHACWVQLLKSARDEAASVERGDPITHSIDIAYDLDPADVVPGTGASIVFGPGAVELSAEELEARAQAQRRANVEAHAGRTANLALLVALDPAVCSLDAIRAIDASEAERIGCQCECDECDQFQEVLLAFEYEDSERGPTELLMCRNCLLQGERLIVGTAANALAQVVRTVLQHCGAPPITALTRAPTVMHMRALEAALADYDKAVR